MRRNILIRLMVLMAAIAPATLRVAREQLSRYQPPVASEVLAVGRSPVPVADRRCQQCNLAGADLSGQDLNRKNLREADLSAANLTGTQIINAVLHQANL